MPLEQVRMQEQQPTLGVPMPQCVATDLLLGAGDEANLRRWVADEVKGLVRGAKGKLEGVLVTKQKPVEKRML